MAQRNDQVFQLSLTEIAFTIAFILLLLLGYLVFKEESLRRAAEAELAKVQSAESASAALNAAELALKAMLQRAGVGSPDEVITKLIAVEDVRAERDRLKHRVEDLDATLTALEELRKRLEETAQSSRPDITREEVSTALALQDQVRKAIEDAESTSATVTASAPEPTSKPSRAASGASAATSSGGSGRPEQTVAFAASQALRSAGASSPKDGDSRAFRAQRDTEALSKVRQAIAVTGEFKKQLKAQLKRDFAPGQETQTVREIVTAAKGYGEIAMAGANREQVRRENSDLRGQVAFLKNRLDARGGRDYPPCWADEEGKVEFLFSVDLKPNAVVVTPAWPPRREAAARALPGMAELLVGPHSTPDFVSGVQGIFNSSKSQDPECRYYVQLRSSIADAVQSDRARLMVENYFYKTEVRR